MTDSKPLKTKWGNWWDFQIAAEAHVTEQETIPRGKLLGFQLPPRVVTREKKIINDQVKNDVNAHRTFRYRCGLIKAVTVISQEADKVLFYLDGFQHLRMPAAKVSFCLCPDLDEACPVVDILLEGYGTHDDRFNIETVTVWCKDEAQLKDHCVAIGLSSGPKQKTRTIHRENEESSGAWPFIGGLIVGGLLD